MSKQDVLAEVRGINKAERFFQIFEDPSNYEALNKLSIEDLKKLNAMIIETIKTKRNVSINNKKSNINVGDIVEVNHSKFKNEIFEVIKLNPQKAKLKRENGQIWNIPYSLIVNN